MSFTLPELPYAHDALQPYMSKETLEYHHDKHHQAYVTNGNNLLKGTEWRASRSRRSSSGAFGKNPALFNNAGQHYNHSHFWKWMKPNGGGKIPGALEKALVDGFGSVEKAKEDLSRPERGSSVRAGPWLAVERQGRCDQDAERREPARAWRHADPRRRRLGALLLHRLPQPPARLSQGVRRQSRQLGICCRALREGGKVRSRRSFVVRLMFLSLQSSTPVSVSASSANWRGVVQTVFLAFK